MTDTQPTSLPAKPLAESEFFGAKRVVVTGGVGTVGSELVRQLLQLPVEEVRVLDNDENGLFSLGEELGADERLQVFHCDVRDAQKVERMFAGMHIAFHTAALKHVPLCERSPFSTVNTNIVGVQNVIQAARTSNVSHLLFTSSDKAVNPTNVMGTSKLMGERLITASNAAQEHGSNCVFVSTRFGNIAGSRGSVIPLFCKQIRDHGRITLTDPEMTRFIMSLESAVSLLLETIQIARGGEVFVTKMSCMRIIDLARVIIRLMAPVYGRRPDDIKILEIGPRPGEKFWEELTTEEEVRRTFDLDRYLVVLPAFRDIYNRIEFSYPDFNVEPVETLYHSRNVVPLTESEIETFLLEAGVLPQGGEIAS